jgi:hypothetical protein
MFQRRSMRSLVATGLAALMAMQGVVAHADPAAPEAGSIRGHREDADRLGEPLRDLDRAAAPEPAAAPAGAVVPPVGGDPHRVEAAARLDRGVAAYRAGDHAHAVSELVEASRLSPDWPDPYRWLALVEIEIDDCASATLNTAALAARVPPGDHRVAELVALRTRCLHRPTLEFGSQFGSQPGAVDSLRAAEATFTATGARDRPLVERWWLWAAVGLATATVIGVIWATNGSGSGPGAMSGPSGDHGLPGVTCDATGCHP